MLDLLHNLREFDVRVLSVFGVSCQWEGIKDAHFGESETLSENVLHGEVLTGFLILFGSYFLEVVIDQSVIFFFVRDLLITVF